MAWPTPQDYNEAVQSPAVVFADPNLKSGTIRTSPLGLPVPIAGRFAIVYRIDCGRKSFAVRCFQTEQPDQKARYAAISKQLSRLTLPFLVGFEFVEQGIRIKGEWYPILKMDWAEGDPLSAYVQTLLGNGEALRALAKDWLAVLNAMQTARIAHGDLQDGNVLVAAGRIKLVDYDGMFVPELSGRPSAENGHRNYQHPKRSRIDFGPAVDNFSGWAIYVSLIALSYDPSIWEKVNGGDECLIFREKDYKDPDSSKAFQILESHPDLSVRMLSRHLRDMLRMDCTQVPSVVSTAPPKQIASSSDPSSGWWTTHTAPIDSSRTGATTSSHSVKGPTASSVAPGDGWAWVIDHVHNPRPPLSFNTPTVAARRQIGLAGGTGIFIAGACGPAFGYPAVLIPIVLVAWSIEALYRKDESVVLLAKLIRTRTQHRQSISWFSTEARSIASKVDWARNEVRDLELRRNEAFDKHEMARRQNLDTYDRQLGHRRTDLEAKIFRAQIPLTETRRKADMAVSTVDSKLQQALGNETHAIRLAQEKLEREHVEGILRTTKLRAGLISGIGEATVSNLRASGFSSAFDMTWRVQNVYGIGWSKASDLVRWSGSIEAAARQTAPKTLPASTSSQITATYQQQISRLTLELKTAKQQAESMIRNSRVESQRQTSQLEDALRKDAEETRKAKLEANLQHDASRSQLEQAWRQIIEQATQDVSLAESELKQTQEKVSREQYAMAKVEVDLTATKNLKRNRFLRWLVSTKG